MVPMALTASLGRAGFVPKRLATQAVVSLEQVDGKQALIAQIDDVPPDTLREKAPDGAVASAVKRVFGAGEEKIKAASPQFTNSPTRIARVGTPIALKTAKSRRRTTSRARRVPRS